MTVHSFQDWCFLGWSVIIWYYLLLLQYYKIVRNPTKMHFVCVSSLKNLRLRIFFSPFLRQPPVGRLDALVPNSISPPNLQSALPRRRMKPKIHGTYRCFWIVFWRIKTKKNMTDFLLDWRVVFLYLSFCWMPIFCFYLLLLAGCYTQSWNAAHATALDQFLDVFFQKKRQFEA